MFSSWKIATSCRSFLYPLARISGRGRRKTLNSYECRKHGNRTFSGKNNGKAETMFNWGSTSFLINANISVSAGQQQLHHPGLTSKHQIGRCGRWESNERNVGFSLRCKPKIYFFRMFGEKMKSLITDLVLPISNRNMLYGEIMTIRRLMFWNPGNIQMSEMARALASEACNVAMKELQQYLIAEGVDDIETRIQFLILLIPAFTVSSL